MDIDRLMRLSNVFAAEKSKEEAIRYLALNVCQNCLPAIVYISEITSELRFKHYVSFGVSSDSLESTRNMDATLVKTFNQVITNDQLVFQRLNNEFFSEFKGIQIGYRPDWKTVVIFPVLPHFLVTITFQVVIEDNEVNRSYFTLLRGLLAVYLSGIYELETRGKITNHHKNKEENFGKELTDRQTQIVELIKEGHTNNFIALELGFSESLIRQETIIIYQKLGIDGRREINLK